MYRFYFALLWFAMFSCNWFRCSHQRYALTLFDPRLDCRGAGVPIPAAARDFSLLHRIQTGSGPTQPFAHWAPSFFSRAKVAGREVNCLPPSSAEVKITWSYSPTPPYILVAWCFIKHKENFTFNDREICELKNILFSKNILINNLAKTIVWGGGVVLKIYYWINKDFIYNDSRIATVQKVQIHTVGFLLTLWLSIVTFMP
jgi:hypothetical protein